MIEAHNVSDNYKLIWDIVREIPKGKIATYGEIARVSGLLNQARLIGYALHNLPPRSKIPWHRVINSQGKISFPKNTGTHRQQKKLLEKEGIVFTKDKVDFGKYGWLRGTISPRRVY
jgi:methylated-DNA-protein-cysteine methyltransferase-like protein